MLAALVGLAFVVAIIVVVASSGSGSSPTSTVPRLAASTTAPTPTTAGPTTVVATTNAPSTTVAEETTTTTEPPNLVLRPDGLGELTFGDDAELAILTLGELLGSPDEDTGWVNQAEAYGVCIGTEVRFVRWGSLQIFLTDGPSDWAPAGVRHIAHYADSSFLGESLIPSNTAEGIGQGSTVDDIIGAYGVAASIEDDPLFGPTFTLDTAGAGFLIGSLTGIQSGDRLQSLSAGFACGE